jgi:hypothetical protein
MSAVDDTYVYNGWWKYCGHALPPWSLTTRIKGHHFNDTRNAIIYLLASLRSSEPSCMTSLPNGPLLLSLILAKKTLSSSLSGSCTANRPIVTRQTQTFQPQEDGAFQTVHSRRCILLSLCTATCPELYRRQELH